MRRSLPQRRHNPYEAAIGRVAEGVQSVLAKTPPPQHIEEAVADFDRRMADPIANRHEWVAIIRRHGWKGYQDYINTMTEAKKTWGY